MLSRVVLGGPRPFYQHSRVWPQATGVVLVPIHAQQATEIDLQEQEAWEKTVVMGERGSGRLNGIDACMIAGFPTKQPVLLSRPAPVGSLVVEHIQIQFAWLHVRKAAPFPS